MPVAAPRPCTYPGCNEQADGRSSRCKKHQTVGRTQYEEDRKKYDQERGSAHQRGYGARWRKAREGFLRNHPLCRMCEAQGRVTPATIVDHITPHKGDSTLFWSKDNWQPLCKPCHDRHKQRLERSGTEVGCNVSGVPTDKFHHWNTGQGG